MASLFLTAELFGRQRSAIISLAVAAAIMVGINPQTLWDVAFQLSFAAMAGLMLITPLLETPTRRALERSKIRGFSTGFSIFSPNIYTVGFSFLKLSKYCSNVHIIYQMFRR
jgi:competence protein ComEC